LGLVEAVLKLKRMHKIYILLMGACLWLGLTRNLHAQCNLSATSSGANAAYTQVYVLVDAATGNIVAQNSSGSFNAVAPGNYHIHALNYDPSNAPAPLPAALIGQAVSLVGSTSAGCFNADFLTDFVNRSCASCTITRTICETDAFLVSTSSENAAYTQLYVLVDAATGLIVATNSSGDFTGLVSDGNSYQVHALNYDPAQVPNPLPTVGQALNAIGTIASGCYNSDYLSDYICYNVTPCGTTCFRNTSLCIGQDIAVSTTGENEAYTQVYILTDASGNFLAQNSSGVFLTTALPAGDYRVYALNYNPAAAPTPLPDALAVGAAISSVSGGCYNADFLTDYLCFNLNCLLGTNLLSFRGEKENSRNRLDWTVDNNDDLPSFVLERSANGYANFSDIGTIFSVEGINNYHFFDELPLPLSYYRLRSVLPDGSFTYSNTVVLEREKSPYKDILVYPNPTRNNMTIELNALEAAEVELQVFNVLGQSLQRINLQVQVGLNRWELNMQDYASGMYILALKQGSWQQLQKIVKEQ
jgi:hypothetical protein